MKVAIIGATGAVGREMIQEVDRIISGDVQLTLLASPRSAGTTLDFRGKRHTVQPYSLDRVQEGTVVLMSAGGDFSKEHSKALARKGCFVIDNSSAWRMDPEVPLVVPEVNAELLKTMKFGIIANPNCSTIQMVVPLAAIDKHFGLEMVEVSTYQSVSGTGQKGMSELSEQVQAHFKFQELAPKVYSQSIAFNVISGIGSFDSAGHCAEEEKMVRETRKILSRSELPVFATTARVPVISCHCESVLVRTKKAVTALDVKKLLGDTPGVVYVDDSNPAMAPSPRNVAGEPGIYVSRVRTPFGEASANWIQFWVVADNLKKGAATNAVQIFEYLLSHGNVAR
jgi:aspartate-semialdehyde dehydrogenase